MKKIAFGNSLMLASLLCFVALPSFMILPGTILAIAGVIMSVIGLISKD